MNFKKILGGSLAALMMTSASSACVYASVEKALQFTALPITDFTGNEVTELKTGDVVILPVEATGSDGRIQTGQFEVDYDNTILSLGVNAKASSDTIAFYKEKKSLLITSTQDSNTMLLGGREIIESYDDILEEYTYAKDQFAVVPIDEDTVRVTWNGASPTGYAVTDAAEFYVCFTVKDTANVSELNTEYVKKLFVMSSLAGTNDTIGQKYDGTYNKLNACYGAFNINIDSSALPYWIQGLKVSLNDGAKVDVTEYTTTDGVNFTFPVRVTTNNTNAATATVEVFADTSADAEGTKDIQSDVSMGTFEISLNSPTSYADNTVTAATVQ